MFTGLFAAEAHDWVPQTTKKPAIRKNGGLLLTAD
jgi:hypothetical protein